jgi:hypothetical protein
MCNWLHYYTKIMGYPFNGKFISTVFESLQSSEQHLSIEQTLNLIYG